MGVFSHHHEREMVMITTRTWAIAGAAAALFLVPAGVSYAVTTAADDTPPAPIERVQARDQLRVDRPLNDGPAVGPMNRMGGGPQAQAQGGGQVRDQTRDQMRDQMRDTENCDGAGPMGDGPQARSGAGRGGMMGGYGSGR